MCGLHLFAEYVQVSRVRFQTLFFPPSWTDAERRDTPAFGFLGGGYAEIRKRHGQCDSLRLIRAGSARLGPARPGSARLGPALPGSARRGFGTGRPQITCTALGSHLLREETEKDVRQRAMSRCPRTQTVVFVDKLRDCLRDASRGRRTPLRRGSHLLFLGHKPNGTHQLATSFFLKINSKFFSEMRLSRKSFGHPPQDGAPKISVQHGGCIAAMFVSSQRHLVVSGRTTLCFDSLIGYNFILDVQRLRCGAPKCIEYYHEGYFAWYSWSTFPYAWLIKNPLNRPKKKQVRF